MVHHEDAAGDVGFSHCCKNVGHPCDHGSVAPIALAKQDDAWLRSFSEREQARIVEIDGNDRSSLLLRACHDDGIGFTCESEIGAMRRVVTAVDKPSREPGRKRHVDEEPHLAGEDCNSTVSSSARKAA